MNTSHFVFLLVLSLVIAPAATVPPQAQNQQLAACDSCAAVKRALESFETVKPGMRRSQVEESFVVAGGMTFRSTTRYEFKDCSYLSFEIEYSLDPKSPSSFSGEDRVLKVSKLTVDYPTKD
jgi:hypothetical protein